MMFIIHFRLFSGWKANVCEVIRFISKSERERTRLIREARALYDSVFPPVDRISEQRDGAAETHATSSAAAYRSDGVLS